MTKTLVIVESPAKAKTIKKYLGAGYDVLASKGHVKDLPSQQQTTDAKGNKIRVVDVSNDFTETYRVIEGKEKVLDELKAAAKKVDEVLLATDPDREGEAIAFHIAEEIKSPKLKIERVEFHEITKRGIDHGVQNPRKLDDDLYDAQRARRVLDRIVGYDVSALVWDKLAFGLSAGRVQSVALRLVVDREREIEAFKPVEYWNVSAVLKTAGGQSITAKLASADGGKIEVTSGEQAAAVRADLESAAHRVVKVTRKEQKRNPPAPFTTSKLQQDATSYLHFGAKRTMQIAQALYEGIDLKRDGGPVGLITYMRTDSTRISDDAINEVRAEIEKVYGKDFVPAQPNVYKSKKNAQDAHEAIRPTSVDLHPDAIKKHLKDEQYKLYKLIWNRFVGSQMVPAVYDRTVVDIESKPSTATPHHAIYGLRATGRILKHAGWLQVSEGQREFAGEDEGDAAAPADPAAAAQAPAAAEEETAEALLPDLGEGDKLALAAAVPAPAPAPDAAAAPSKPSGVLTEQKFTQPPARYNEGSLVRELEKRGIGRPSTYAEIIGKVQQRAYAEKVASGGFQPTLLGKFVVDGLVRSNLDFMDPGFTAQMEEELDEVGAGHLKRVQLLKRFYKRFREQLDKSKKLASWKPVPERTDIPCEECGAVMLKKWGKNGWFLSCERYPECKGTKDLAENGAPAAVRETDIVCDKCGKPMVIKNGRFGEFLTCTGYPGCKNARPVPLGVACPKCGGDLIEVRPKKRGGRSFYGCSNYNAEQKCDFKLWQKPVPVPCPQCGATFLTRGGGKKPLLLCATKDCGYKKELEEEDGEGLTTAPDGAPDGASNGADHAGHVDGAPPAAALKPAAARPAPVPAKPVVPAKAAPAKAAPAKAKAAPAKAAKEEPKPKPASKASIGVVKRRAASAPR
jgi:DNA topoisomerase I